MDFAHWSTLVGTLLVVMALSVSLLQRAPLSSSIVYLAVGAALSPWWTGALQLDLLEHASWIEHLAEIVVLISLFTAGLKMSSHTGDPRWALPLRLATTSMLVTVVLVTLVGVLLLGLPLGAAVLLGAILAPTDPVLASDVQIAEPGDRDRLRFALTGEGGLNDGAAFPLVMLGLGLLGVHELGPFGLRWVAIDLVWATGCGLAVGALLGTGIGEGVLHLRRRYKSAVGLDNFIALGLTALAYGIAALLHGYGFLAVFAAGFAYRRVERRDAAKRGSTQPAAVDAPPASLPAAPGLDNAGERESLATHEAKAGAFMAHAALSFNEQIERIAEVLAVVLVGALLWSIAWREASWLLVVLLLVVVRPVAVAIGLARSDTSRLQRRLIAWFGIRGIGSIYYLAYSVTHGLPADLAGRIAALTLAVVAASVLLHGVSVTPLMAFYERRKSRAS
ncbi:MAG TPA: cation:proton antiporter [Methylibium sp.]|uniref:cation:proton antiporter n=1 Tax=Methylibium sp. TaxID=2067992 RepID=UPI002DBE2E37|nr:cation:proton antiporter [Methylibium sp.]HEU4459337.1 cation:proton antiporter [Methylibium sp.]